MRIKGGGKLTDLKWLNLFNIHYIDSRGEEREWQVATHHKHPKCMTGQYAMADAVVIVPFHHWSRKDRSDTGVSDSFGRI